MVDAVVHVFDPGEPGKTRDFTCSIHTLTHGMRYFKDVLQKSIDSRITPVEISVHCDVAVFEWLLGYCNGSVTREHITVEGVLQLLIASNFLQMDPLVTDCLAFMANNLAAVAQHQQQLTGQGGNLTALPMELLTRLARVVPERRLEELASLSPADVRARHMPLVNRLYKYKLEGCLKELRTTVARCSVCQGLFSLADRAKLECPGPPPPPQPKGTDGPGGRASSSSHTQRRSSSGSVHIPDAAWRLQEHLSALRAQQIAWRGIYWHVWGLVHVLYCHTCMQHVPAAQLRCCAFHPQPPVFTTAAARQPSAGFYPCCGAAAVRGADPRVTAASGCCAREHRLLPSGQAPGAPLPPGLTPELLTTLQHCTTLFTNSGALLVREPGADAAAAAAAREALGAGAAIGAFAGDRHVAAAASTAAAGPATAADAVAGVAATKSPRARPVSFLGNSSTARDRSGEILAADADGRLVPPAVAALLSSATVAAAAAAAAATAAASAPRRSDSAAAATAAALGYSLRIMPGLDSGASGPGPPQLPLPPQLSAPAGLQSPRAQPPGLGGPSVNSPLRITGNPQVDTQRIAAAVARRLSRSGTGGGCSGGGGSRAGTADGAAPAQVAHSQHQQHRHPLEHHLQHQQQQDHVHSYQQQYHQQQQRQRQQPHEQRDPEPQPHGRRLVLDTARSFTSLAALQLEAAQEGAAAAASRFPATTPARSAAAAAGAKAAASPPPAQNGGGGNVSHTTQLERSPYYARSPPRSPRSYHGNRQQQGAQWPSNAGASAAAARAGPSRSLVLRSTSADLIALQLAAPPPSPSAARGGIRPSTDPREDASPPRNSAGGVGLSGPPRSAPGLPLPDGTAAAAAAAAAAWGTALQRPPSPPSYQRHLSQRHHHHQQRHHHHHPHHAPRHSVHVQGSREHAAHRGHAQMAAGERGATGARREVALPPRPSGRAMGAPYRATLAATSLQRRHSGGSWGQQDFYTGPDTDSGGSGDSGGEGEEDDGDRAYRSFLRKGSGVGASDAGKGSRGEGAAGQGLARGASVPPDGNPLQRSVHAALAQQRRLPSQGQADQQLPSQQHQQHQQQQQYQQYLQQLPRQQQQQHHQQQESSHPQQQQHHHQRQAHRQRSAGRARQAAFEGGDPDVSRSWAPGEDAASSTTFAASTAAAAAAQARRALIEQYKTQKVLSPRPTNVHMIAIAELPSGSGGAGGGASDSGGGSDAQAPQPSPRALASVKAHEAAESSSAGSVGAPGGGGLTGGGRGAGAAYAAAMAAMTATAGRPGGAGLFSVAPDDLDTSGSATAVGSMAAVSTEDWQPSRGRKLRMELLYEDDNYRMDLLVKHLLACRPSHRAVGGTQDQRPSLRARSALAPSSRTGPGGGAGRGRPVSAAAALYGGLRQARPRSQSVSHVQRLTSVYTQAGVSAGAGQAGAGGAAGGGGGTYGGRVGGGAAPPDDGNGGGRAFDAHGGGGRPDGAFGGGGYAGMGHQPRYSETDECGGWEKMGAGGPGWSGSLAGGAGGGAARRSQDHRPLSAPRTWRYT
ncbi:hypothetical protein PLESTB_000519300 [Pleodorina starrii]|uniref:SANT and BTB domain-containing protein n=1 Tax=Pleodorina starrii TaxID=330485 RepID=A0A9W6BGY7_9CHLO|nr:hypothetical protein PLESTB_000519300 [Pleodorina starrii]GLC72362.1 hypothetical protein PLESTF_001239600 [Pleodorina starrii]